MIANDASKRKRLVQPTLDEIFKKQKVEQLKEAGPSSGASFMEDNVETQNKDSQSLLQTVEADQGDTLKPDSTCSTSGKVLDSLHANETNKPVRLGSPFNSLNQAPDCSGTMPTLNPHPGHTILFRPYVSYDKPPRPYPDTYRDSWDRDHVRMPCSRESLYPVKNVPKKLLSRWELIRTSLLCPMTSSYDLQEAILAYNAHYAKRWNFRTLHLYFLEKVTAEYHKEFFSTTLPGIIQLALQLPIICTQALPLLKRQHERTITLSQQQAATLLANAFLCTFPRRNGVRNLQHEFGNYPDINFSRFFQGEYKESQRKIEKLKCILHYFKKVTEQLPRGTISFKRQVLRPDETPKWHSCSSSLCQLRVSSDGTIENDAPGFLQVDFANEFVGGGVLGEGCVQEEIRFAICPELILSRLFTERLEENECLLINGAERCSSYCGYAETFRWLGNYDDEMPRDNWGRLQTEVVAIDAKHYTTYSEQFSPPHLKRDLDKAFCGFMCRGTEPKNMPAVATGNWGCGAFNGDCQLKSLIQIMAASATRRDLLYFTFGDKQHAQDLYEIHSLLQENNVTVESLWQILNEFNKEVTSSPSSSSGIFSYIRKLLETGDVCDATSDERSSPHDRTPTSSFDDEPS